MPTVGRCEAWDTGEQPVDERNGETTHGLRVSDGIRASFEAHVARLQDARRARKEQLRPKSIVEALLRTEEGAAPRAHSKAGPQAGACTSRATLPIITPAGNLDADSVWTQLEEDRFDGDAVIRCLNTLLDMIDDRGYQRSPHQMRFHDAFIRATARVIYKSEWGAQKPSIMDKNKWERCPSEILISTPRRFGKTYRYVCLSACCHTHRREGVPVMCARVPVPVPVFAASPSSAPR
jgi:hypothetical protein